MARDAVCRGAVETRARRKLGLAHRRRKLIGCVPSCAAPRPSLGEETGAAGALATCSHAANRPNLPLERGSDLTAEFAQLPSNGRSSDAYVLAPPQLWRDSRGRPFDEALGRIRPSTENAAIRASSNLRIEKHVTRCALTRRWNFRDFGGSVALPGRLFPSPVSMRFLARA